MEKWAKSQNNKKFSVATKKPVAAKPQTVVAAAFVSQVKGQIENEAVEDGADEPEEEVKEKEPEESCPAPDQQSKVLIKYLTRQMLNVASLRERRTNFKKVDWKLLIFCTI